MGVLIIITCIPIAGLLVLNMVILSEVLNEETSYENLLNPIVIYRNHKVNIFGCIVLTLLGNIAFCPAAPFYWFYKLCTVGRR